MKDKLSVRQICFILSAYNAASKLLLYPSSAANMANNDLIFPALFNLILQTIIIWSVAYLSSRTEKTFFELLSDTFGKVVARIVYALFALYFVFAAIVPMNEQQLLVHDAFYDTVPSLMVFLPFFFFSIYAGAKGLANAGRCADICFPIFVVTTVILLLMSVGAGDFSNLLPVLKQPFNTLAGSAVASMFRYSESAFLLIFMGHYKYKKGDAAKLTLSYVAGGLVVIALMAVYYTIYGPLTPSRTFLLNNIAVFFSAIKLIGRVDLFALYVFDLVILFMIVLHIQACVHCLCHAFNFYNRALWSVVANAVLIAVTFILNNQFSKLQVASAWFFIPAVIFAYLIPLLSWTLKRSKSERKQT